MKSSPAWIIQKKRDGEELSAPEIREFIHGIASGEVADYQAAAFLMATFFKGMSFQETAALTQAMLESGERYDLSAVKGPKVDKHSTGGVGDKVSIILAPLAAACGLIVPMMSGRGLGHSGGTLDKLESIPGFDVHLSYARFIELLGAQGCAMIGQSETIAPVDKKLYALRDVTATVECIPLITASILSKKLAEGTGALLLDVKVGNGAFMKTREQARRLSKTIVAVSKKMGLPCRALLTNMDQPLGYAVGNRLEIDECVAVLRNEKNSEFSSSDLKEVTLQLCAHMLVLGRVCRKLPDGRKLANSKLADGSAWTVFKALVRAQGGDVSRLTGPSGLPPAPVRAQWKAKTRGYVAFIDTEQVGRILIELGGGRRIASDRVDPAVGLVFHKKLGARVREGDTIAVVHASGAFSAGHGHDGQNGKLSELEARFMAAVRITGVRKPVPKLVLEVI